MTERSQKKKPRLIVTITLLSLLVCTYAYITYSRNALWADELTLWEDVIKKSPDKARGYTYIGIAHARAERFDIALERLVKAASLDPGNVETRLNLGVLFMNTKRYRLAEREFKFVIDRRPELIEPYLKIAGLYEKTGHPELTIEALKSAPGDPGILVGRATAYARTGRLKEAERDFMGALAADPNRVEATTGIGNIRLIQNRFNEALAQYAKTLRLSPEEPHALYNSAITLEKLNRGREALPYYERFIAVAKGDDNFKESVIESRRRAEYLKK